MECSCVRLGVRLVRIMPGSVVVDASERTENIESRTCSSIAAPMGCLATCMPIASFSEGYNR